MFSQQERIFQAAVRRCLMMGGRSVKPQKSNQRGSARAPARVGYARVSTDDQDVALQRDALDRDGCTHIFEDLGVSGVVSSRPGLNKALGYMVPGDTLVVWRLDRLGRSLHRLVELITSLGERGVQFRSITEAIDTSSPGGVLMFHMMAALAEFERAVISERTRAGMAAAQARGKKVGRKPALSPQQLAQAKSMMNTHHIDEAARHFNVHPRTLRRLLAKTTEVAQGAF